MVTREQLLRIMPNATERIDKFTDPLNAAMAEFAINTIPRITAFLGQVAHESGELRYVRELASGEAYEGRKDLGNNNTGDGVRYKGRGLIQITGKNNYRACSNALGLDLLAKPELIEEPINACRSASWFWQAHSLNEIADQGDLDAYKHITKIINGGYNGWVDRVKYWQRALLVLHGVTV